uniref:Ribonuclease T2 n=1 Tax=Todarodes pacificus TaxID=6637 RepID=Q7M439_TODPA
KDTHFDFFVFTQQWPPAVCVEAQAHGHLCSIPSDVKGWVVHGLWPSRKTDRMGPFFCNNTYSFDENKIKPIEAEMRKYWPNLFADSPDLSFWKHEWKKHGTCSLSDKLTPDEFGYFNTALNLFKKYNITSILGHSGVIPNTYTAYEVNDFSTAVENALNIVPVITCIYDKMSKHHYIMQVEICIDKELNAISCPDDHSEASSARNCPASKGIWYPPIIPQD